jgi:hypothetical protein
MNRVANSDRASVQSLRCRGQEMVRVRAAAWTRINPKFADFLYSRFL